MPMIQSLLDTDLYKLTMAQVALHQFSDTWVTYKFKCRNADVRFSFEMVDLINDEINKYCQLMFTEDELKWLSSLRYIKKDFIEFLRLYRPQRRHVQIVRSSEGELDITVEGPWFLTIFFEVPILAIVNEVYFEKNVIRNLSSYGLQGLFSSAKQALQKKVEIAKDVQFLFSDFGTRRRFSSYWQDEVIGFLAEELPRNVFGGTSNMYFAKKYGLSPIGTMAHEFIQIGQGLNDVALVNSQSRMLQAWVDEYRGDLGTALTDTLGVDKFLKDFDLYFSKLYDGVRHDSGDPFNWGERMIKHYESMKIDSTTKQFVWSDGLTFKKAAEIYDTFKNRARCSFGIGTNLTNDFPTSLFPPLNIVMKVVAVGEKSVAKISDSPGKGMCEDEDFLSYLKKVISE